MISHVTVTYDSLLKSHNYMSQKNIEGFGTMMLYVIFHSDCIYSNL